MENIDILNELAEHVSYKINSCKADAHNGGWLEKKVHKDYDLWLMLEGQVFVEMNGTVYTAEEGDIVFFYPGMPYSATTGQAGCRFIFIHFDFSVGDNFRILNDFSFAGILSGDLLKDEVRQFEAGLRSSATSGVSSLLLKGHVAVLLARLIDLCRTESGKKCSFPQTHAHKYKNRLAILKPVFKYISSHIGQKIRAGELSALLCMSEKYFISFFKQTVGVSPLVYINQVKMNQARNYLWEGSRSIKEISSLLGYADPYTFSKAFKKHYNVSPSQFF